MFRSKRLVSSMLSKQHTVLLISSAIASACTVGIAATASAQQKHSIWMALPPPEAKETTTVKPAKPAPQQKFVMPKMRVAAPNAVQNSTQPAAQGNAQPPAETASGAEAGASASATTPATTGMPQVFALPPSKDAKTNASSFPGYPTANEIPLVNAVCPGVNPRKLIVDRLQEMGVSTNTEVFKLAHLDIIDSPEVQKLFPKRLFYSLRTPYGASKPPDPLAKRTILLLDDVGNFMPMTDWTELQRLFISQGIKVSDEQVAAQTTKAWMALHQQLVRSDAFAFEAPSEPQITKAENGSITAQGQLDAEYEGKKVGHLKVYLQFDQNGRLSMVNEDSTLPPG